MANGLPDWSTDELILALDLYLREGHVGPNHPKTIALSDTLNSLPIHTVRPDLERFRNPNGVALKLANLAALDPAYPGVGMTRGGKGDREVWDRYHDRPEEVASLASAIRGGVSGAEAFPVVPEEDEEGVEEGRLLYRRHRARERSRALVQRKKADARKRGLPLACEACGFDFEKAYGELGKDYIECHHLVPLADTGPVKNRLSDLALVCSNCHRMAHRRRPWPKIADLRKLLGR